MDGSRAKQVERWQLVVGVGQKSLSGKTLNDVSASKVILLELIDRIRNLTWVSTQGTVPIRVPKITRPCGIKDLQRC